MTSYARQTIDSPNPIARFSHRNRLKRSVQIARKLTTGRILDYGCGAGHFIQQVGGIGYEPYMTERIGNLPIYNKFEDIKGSFDLVTLFETIEHLDDQELDEFLGRCKTILSPDGKILFSAPIEIGPALLLKQLKRRGKDYRFVELIKAVFFGVPGERAKNIKTSHKGFDFRLAINTLKTKGWDVNIIGYGPLPISWYGNSQVYFVASCYGISK